MCAKPTEKRREVSFSYPAHSECRKQCSEHLSIQKRSVAHPTHPLGILCANAGATGCSIAWPRARSSC
eukprot:845465-Pleurochrysis_carterae.AAC.2